MIIGKMTEMYRGWFIGNFEPSILKTSQFEVGLLLHREGEEWPEHYHTMTTEYNVLISGSMSVNHINIFAGEYFIIKANECVKPIFHEDCVVLCVKVPSIPGDKYIV